MTVTPLRCPSDRGCSVRVASGYIVHYDEKIVRAAVDGQGNLRLYERRWPFAGQRVFHPAGEWSDLRMVAPVAARVPGVA